ncbi:MAG: hypothetical protein M3Y09_21165, partial [Actinomycetota bacterium]|nr:hypothetical protein [Actinomycetota bacterium]
MSSAAQPRPPGGESEPGPVVVDGTAVFGQDGEEGAPSVPAEARGELLALKSGAAFVCVRPDGDIRAGPVSGEGLYARDTRHLSELRLSVGGRQPVLLSSAVVSGHHAVINATNATLTGAAGTVAQETINIRRTVVIGERLYYEVRLQSFCPSTVRTTVELVLAADFADVFEVREVGRRSGGQTLAPSFRDGRLSFVYVAKDGQRRTTTIGLSPAPTRVDFDGQRGHVVWEVELPPAQPCALCVTVEAD